MLHITVVGSSALAAGLNNGWRGEELAPLSVRYDFCECVIPPVLLIFHFP